MSGTDDDLSIEAVARRLQARLCHVHQVKSDGVILGTPLLYPDGGRVSLYLSSDRPGLFFISDFEGGRRRALMEGEAVAARFDARVRAWPFDPPLVIEGHSIYVRVPAERLPEAAVVVANASTVALREALVDEAGGRAQGPGS